MTEINNEKIKELSRILSISENKIINKIIDNLNPLNFISEIRNENKWNVNKKWRG